MGSIKRKTLWNSGNKVLENADATTTNQVPKIAPVADAMS